MMNNTYSNRNSKSPVWKASHPYTAPDPVRICLWRGLRTPAGIQHNPRPYRQQSEPDCKAYERHGQCLWSRCKRSKGADETGMAITKIHAIKATVHKAVDYICDPAKLMKVSSFLPLGAVLKPQLMTSNLPFQKPVRQTQTKPFIWYSPLCRAKYLTRKPIRSAWSLPTNYWKENTHTLCPPTLTKDTSTTTSFSVLQITSITKNITTAKRAITTSGT